MTRESPEARAERILGELRAATAEAAGVVKDLERVIRLARERVDEYAIPQIDAKVNETAADIRRDYLALAQSWQEKINVVFETYDARIATYVEREPLITAAVNQVYTELAPILEKRAAELNAQGMELNVVIGPKKQA